MNHRHATNDLALPLIQPHGQKQMAEGQGQQIRQPKENNDISFNEQQTGDEHLEDEQPFIQYQKELRESPEKIRLQPQAAHAHRSQKEKKGASDKAQPQMAQGVLQPEAADDGLLSDQNLNELPPEILAQLYEQLREPDQPPREMGATDKVAGQQLDQLRELKKMCNMDVVENLAIKKKINRNFEVKNQRPGQHNGQVSHKITKLRSQTMNRSKSTYITDGYSAELRRSPFTLKKIMGSLQSQDPETGSSERQPNFQFFVKNCSESSFAKVRLANNSKNQSTQNLNKQSLFSLKGSRPGLSRLKFSGLEKINSPE